MKEKCESIFIELVSPYLTAIQQANIGSPTQDWHGVFAFAETIKEEMERLKGKDARLLDVFMLAEQLSDIAVNQESRVIHREEPSGKLDQEAIGVLAQLQSKLREVIIDNVCACEAGTEIITAYAEGKFPQQDRALATIKGLSGSINIVHVHDDGDLTVESDGKKYVVTIEGDIFGQQ